MGYNPWGHKEWDTTEHEHACEFHMPKSHHPLQMGTAAMQLKDTCSLEEKHLAVTKKNYDKPRQHIEKQRHYFANKVKAMVFPVVMYGCESWNVKKAER